MFDPAREDLAAERAELVRLATVDEYQALRRTTLNAHYTDARYVQAIWAAVGQLGFASGRVLEPGCGSGNFIGFAPDAAELTGIELDPVTAEIAAALYPQATIRAESFADTSLPAGYFDAAIGNVPFGRLRLSDRRHNPGRRLSIHDHFLVKALALTRPGGLVAVLTSRFTMDSRNPQARRQIADLADLVGAIRLPSGAHRRAAGTEVVTDLLILRRRGSGAQPGTRAWEKALPRDLPGGQAHVNQYFTEHPDLVLGEMRIGRGAHGAADLEVTVSGDTAAALADALGRVVSAARADGLVMTEAAAAPEPNQLTAIVPTDDQIEGLIQAWPDGTFTRLTADPGDPEQLHARPYSPPGRQAAELRALTGLRDTVLALLRAEAATLDDTEDIGRLRSRLNTSYNSYVARYGPVKRLRWVRTGKADPETGEHKQTRRRPDQGGFRQDPLYPLVYALEENYDAVTSTATKADIFTERVVVPEPQLLGADTPAEALAICLNSFAEVRLDEIARLLGAASEAEARQELGTLVYDEPGTGQLIWAPLYLSGNVRQKLAAATSAAETDPRFEVNVQALQEVIPRDLGPAEIEAQLGAGWIDARYVQQFLRETLDDPDVTVARTRSRTWRVSGGSRKSVAATSLWGTDRVCAHDIAQRLLTGTAEEIKIVIRTREGTTVDTDATEAARQKAHDLATRFSRWTWEDPDRAEDLCRTYNDRYNAVVPVSFDDVQLYTPGLSPALTLRGHQPAAIARIIYQGSAGLVHDTGAGKTLETIVGVRERQRLGLSHKPCFVVQKHKLGDFREEFLRAYPEARILTADTDDLTGDKRREFVARCATGNPTAIIMSREAFKAIPVSAERQAAFLAQEKEALQRALDEATAAGEDDRTIKQIEQQLLNTEERRKEQLASIGRDRGLCYEDTGIDYLVIDEAQGYRKGPIASSLPGMADPGSQRSLDLLLKLGHHRDCHGETRICLATATPFSNRISEIYTWQRYLAGEMEDFDSWCRTFGKMAVAYEMTPSGDFKAKARLREIINAVDLHLQLRERTDFKLKNTLDLDLPAMTGGKPQIIEVPASPELLAYADDIGFRYRNLRGGPPRKGEDNHLKIQGDAIKAALDMRLVGQTASRPQKVDITADVLHQKWLSHRNDIYRLPNGAEHPVRGSLILVFASLGTPGRPRAAGQDNEPRRYGGWNFYAELREQLAARGMPRRLVRFIHEAANAQQKEELYHACRNGEVAILIGSTEKLGTGTNVQDRAIGLVQVTAPWNWDEPHQELGRVERQGNQNNEYFCLRVVTTPSADAIKWERARQKEHSFRALMSGEIEGRTIRIPDDDLSSAEMMAAASGDPRLLERAELEGTVTRLATLKRAWAQDQTALEYRARHADRAGAQAQQVAEQITAALPQRRDTRGSAFAMIIDGTKHRKRVDAAAHLRELIRQRITQVQKGSTCRVELGEIGGFGLTATLSPSLWQSVLLHLTGLPDAPEPIALDHRALPDQYGIITRLENRLADLEQIQASAAASIEHHREQAAAARAAIGAPFPQQQEYQDASTRLEALEKDLIGDTQKPPDPADENHLSTDGPTSDVEQASSPARAQNSVSPSGQSHPARAHKNRHPTPADQTAHTPRVPAYPTPHPQPAHAEPPGEEHQQASTDLDRARAPQPIPAMPAPPHDGLDAGGSATPGVTERADPPIDQAPVSRTKPPQARSDSTPSGHDAGPAAEVPTGTDHADDSEQRPTASDSQTCLVIEHHQDSTLVHGTSRDDLELHAMLRRHQFRWSGHLQAWYLGRKWRFQTRDARVRALVADLHRAGRAFDLLQQAPQPRAQPAPEQPSRPLATAPASPARTGPHEERAATATSASTRPAHDVPAHSESEALVRYLRRVAAAHGLSTTSGSAAVGRTELMTVHDDGRTVLVCDIDGITVGEHSLAPDQADAYLATYRRYPHLPPIALLSLLGETDLFSRPLQARYARKLADWHGLHARIVGVGGQAYITLHEPSLPEVPVLSYPVNSACAFHGPCAVPVQAVDGYLHAYRTVVPPEMFKAVAQIPDWGPRLIQLTPHLVDGSGYFIQGVQKHVSAALLAARNGQRDEAERLLTDAEKATPQLTAAPERGSGTVSAFGAGSPTDGSAGRPAQAIADEHININAGGQGAPAEPTTGKDVISAGQLPPDPAQEATTAHFKSRQLPDSVSGAGSTESPQPKESATATDQNSGSGPATASDLAMALRQMPASEFARLALSPADQPVPAAGISLHGTSRERRPNEPDPGAREELHFDPKGIRIQITTRSGTRESRFAWRHVANWIRCGATPARHRVLEQALRTHARYRGFADGFTVTGQQHLYRAAIKDLDAIIAAVISATIEAALQASPAAWTRRSRPRRALQQPTPGAGTLFSDAEPGLDDTEAAALDRIARLAAALPDSSPTRTHFRLSELKAGDAICHPGYSFAPFILRETPDDHGDHVTLTGVLAGRQDAVIRWQFHKNGADDPVVATVPLPPSQPPANPEDKRSVPHKLDQSPRPEVPEPVPASKSPQRPAQPPLDPRAAAPRAHDESGPRGETATQSSTRSQAQLQLTTARQMALGSDHPDLTVDGAGDTDPSSAADPDDADQHLQCDPASRAPRSAAREGEGETMADTTLPSANSPVTNVYGDPDPEIADLIAALTDTTNAQEGHGSDARTTPGAGTAAIKAAFAELWQATDLTGSSQQHVHDTLDASRHRTTTANGDFADIRAAFAELRQALDLPPHSPRDNLKGQAHDNPTSPQTTLPELEAAAAEAQACARWYGQTPEWQRIILVSKATRALMTAIRETAGDYWAELRQDIRVRGFARTVAARMARSVASAAGNLARRLEHTRQPGRASSAARRLHRASIGFADALMRYVMPGSNERMREVKRLISDLEHQHQGQSLRLVSTNMCIRGSSASVRSAAKIAQASFPKASKPEQAHKHPYSEPVRAPAKTRRPSSPSHGIGTRY